MKKLRITVGTKTYDVTVEVLSDDSPAPRPAGAQPGLAGPSTPPKSESDSPASSSRSPALGEVGSPMAGTVKSILVKQGEEVAVGKPLVILEAMKMENQIVASSVGTVKKVTVQEGESVQEGQVLLIIE